MFDGAAEEAMSLHVSLFPGSPIIGVERLAEGGQVLMPLDDYGFSARFGWLADRFGVSWQLDLA
jgi:predicted 3-demethylubiquinone-9 3-methyltransferase (glyoxalase superfamily)